MIPRLIRGSTWRQLSRFITSTTRAGERLSDNNIALADGLLRGDRASLSRAITLIESSRPDHQVQSDLFLSYLAEKKANHKGFQNGRTLRLGIAGPPGGGKSTLIESIGLMYVKEGHRVAVIPVDPSSHRSGGSVLGDKTRMDMLSKSPDAYVRACPTRGVLGGIAEHTVDVISLCEHAGYDLIIVESVGLGQSEVELDQAVDMFVLLVSPGGGDDLQASKKGVMEAADLLVVSKADGELLNVAKHTKADYAGTMSMLRPKDHLWAPRVQLVSVKTRQGLEDFMNTASEFHDTMTRSGHLDAKRGRQAMHWVGAHFRRLVENEVQSNPRLSTEAEEAKVNVQRGALSPRMAARSLLNTLRHSGDGEEVH